MLSIIQLPLNPDIDIQMQLWTILFALQAEEILDRCHGAMSPIFQYANIDELGRAVWFLSLDLKDAKERLTES